MPLSVFESRDWKSYAICDVTRGSSQVIFFAHVLLVNSIFLCHFFSLSICESVSYKFIHALPRKLFVTSTTAAVDGNGDSKTFDGSTPPDE